jgi:hypothetical protein
LDRQTSRIIRAGAACTEDRREQSERSKTAHPSRLSNPHASIRLSMTGAHLQPDRL